jgi:F0F1-type ATP synthase assembly protein I
MSESTPPRRRPYPNGMTASSYLIAALVAGVLGGLGLGSLVGVPALGLIAGVFAGFFGGLALVRSRFRDL